MDNNSEATKSLYIFIVFCGFFPKWTHGITNRLGSDRVLVSAQLCGNISFADRDQLSILNIFPQVETATDSEAETKGLPQFQSIGIQVEDHKR